MAINIISPEFSFVRFNDQHIDIYDWYESQEAGAEIHFSLPVYANTDLQFQFIVETTTKSEADILCSRNMGDDFLVSIYKGTPKTSAVFSDMHDSWAGSDISIAQRLRLNDTQILYQVGPQPDFLGEVEINECFQIGIFISNISDGGTTTYYVSAISNQFYKIANTRHTTLFEYYSETDVAGYIYCISQSLKNKIRLPLYLGAPKYPEEESIYRKSDGASVITKASVRKVFEVTTDSLPIWIIEALRAVLLHDTVLVNTRSYNGEVVKEGEFAIEWDEFMNYPHATVNFKLAADNFLAKKNSCGDCDNYDSPISFSIPTITLVVGTNQNAVINFDEHCCSPLKLSVDYYMASRVNNVTMSGTTINWHTISPTLPESPQPLFRIKADCGGYIEYIEIPYLP